MSKQYFPLSFSPFRFGKEYGFGFDGETNPLSRTFPFYYRLGFHKRWTIYFDLFHEVEVEKTILLNRDIQQFRCYQEVITHRDVQNMYYSSFYNLERREQFASQSKEFRLIRSDRNIKGDDILKLKKDTHYSTNIDATSLHAEKNYKHLDVPELRNNLKTTGRGITKVKSTKIEPKYRGINLIGDNYLLNSVSRDAHIDYINILERHSWSEVKQYVSHELRKPVYNLSICEQTLLKNILRDLLQRKDDNQLSTINKSNQLSDLQVRPSRSHKGVHYFGTTHLDRTSHSVSINQKQLQVLNSVIYNYVVQSQQEITNSQRVDVNVASGINDVYLKGGFKYSIINKLLASASKTSQSTNELPPITLLNKETDIVSANDSVGDNSINDGYISVSKVAHKISINETYYGINKAPKHIKQQILFYSFNKSDKLGTITNSEYNIDKQSKKMQVKNTLVHLSDTEPKDITVVIENNTKIQKAAKLTYVASHIINMGRNFSKIKSNNSLTKVKRSALSRVMIGTEQHFDRGKRHRVTDSGAILTQRGDATDARISTTESVNRQALQNNYSGVVTPLSIGRYRDIGISSSQQIKRQDIYKVRVSDILKTKKDNVLLITESSNQQSLEKLYPPKREGYFEDSILTEKLYPPNREAIIEDIEHSTITKRLWFLKHQGNIDYKILPNEDYLYPVDVSTLVTLPDGTFKHTYYTKIKDRNNDLTIRAYNYEHILVSELKMYNTNPNWEFYSVTENDVRLTVHTENDITEISIVLYNPDIAYMVVRQPKDETGQGVHHCATETVVMQSHPIPVGEHLGLKEIPISIEIMIEFINVILMMWAKFFNAYSGQTGVQALFGTVQLLFDWVHHGDGESMEDYYRCFRWVRWEAESLMDAARKDPRLNGNYWIELLIANLKDYMLMHHFEYVPEWKCLEKMDEMRFVMPEGDLTRVLDKYKGIRNKIL